MSFIKESGGYLPTDGRVYAMAKLLEVNSHSPVPGGSPNGYLGRMLGAALEPRISYRGRESPLETTLRPETSYTFLRQKTLQDTYLH